MAGQDREIIHTNSDPESATSDSSGVEESGEALGAKLGSDRELYLNKLVKYVNEIESILQEAGIEWDIRPEFYEVGEWEEFVPNYVWDFIDVNKLLSHILFMWRVTINQTGPNAYAITIEPKKSQLRALQSGGSTPEETIINVIWRYLKEIGTERITGD